MLLTNDGAALQDLLGSDHSGAVERDGTAGRSFRERGARDEDRRSDRTRDPVAIIIPSFAGAGS